MARWFNLGAGVCMAIIAVLKFPPQIVDHPFGRWLVFGLAVLAILLLFTSTLLSHKEEKKSKIEAKKNAEKIKEMHQMLEKWVSNRSVPIAVETPGQVAPQGPPDPDFVGELRRLIISPNTDVPLKKLPELWRMLGHSGEPKIDADILVWLYIVNTSNSTMYVQDVTGSVEVSGVRQPFVKINQFITELADRKFEYVFDPENSSAIEPLQPFALPAELPPNKPHEGWVRFVLKNFNPDGINDSSWAFTIVDSRGNEHAVTKANPRSGELTMRPV